MAIERWKYMEYNIKNALRGANYAIFTASKSITRI